MTDVKEKVDINDLKIKKNEQENLFFSEQLNNFINHTHKGGNLVLGDTPYSLSISGAKQDLNIVIAPKTIIKCLKSPDEKYHGHELSIDIMSKIPDELRNPVMVFKGSVDNSLVAITELIDNENREIMVAIALNDVSRHHEVNRISSVYGRNNMKAYLEKQVSQGNLISCNKNKADRMFQSLGLQLPPEETYISFNDSIAHSLDSVKGFGEKTLNTIKQIPETAAKSKKPTQKNNPFSEKINAARNADLLLYFEKNGYETEKKGSEYYIKEIKGLCINPSKESWYSHYDEIGGTNSIDCLTKILNKDFKTAVEELSSGVTNISFQQRRNNGQHFEKKEKELKIPERAENNNRVIAYLVNTRKIPAEIVYEFINNGKLYQEKNTGNAVFPHIKNGHIVGAEIVGTSSHVRFKGVAAGTESSIFSAAFSQETKKAYVFESAIDLMSFYAMVDKEKNNLDGIAFVSMAGLKSGAIKELEEKGIQILSCVDNDERGIKFETDNGFKRAGNMLEREGVKDWNELWQKNMEAEKSADVPEINEADYKPDENKNNPAELDNFEQDYEEIEVG